MLLFLLYYPAQSFAVGSPIPFPSLMSVTPEQIALFNFLSLIITVLGSVVGIGFYLERRQNLKLEFLRAELKELRKEMKEMEKSLCESMSVKNSGIEKIVEGKVSSAKELVDTKFRNIEDIAKGLQKSIDFMQQFQFGTKAKSKPAYIEGEEETQEHRDQPMEGIYESPDSTETQEHKDEQKEEETELEVREKREKASKERWDKEGEKKK